MNNRENQIYDRYWNYTAALTNLNGEKFLSFLRLAVDFIDNNIDKPFSVEKNRASWEYAQQVLPVSSQIDALASQRKRWNQLVKLGFIRPKLSGYPHETLEYLEATTNRRRTNILSKIVYRYATIVNSTTETEGINPLNFLIRTLEDTGLLSRTDLAAIMTIDVADFGADHATRYDIERIKSEADINGFISRKYNQIDHLRNLLGKLTDLRIHDGTIYFLEDAQRLFGQEDEEARRHGRDPYLQRIYKSELEEETSATYASDRPRCMIDGLAHPVLIASHIKPYRDSLPQEAFDPDNGLLLNRSMDSMFDLGYITFSDDGTIIPSDALDDDMRRYLSELHLNPAFINPSRMAYMSYHRTHVFNRFQR